MLSKNENEVMSAVYSLCDGTDGCLISPLDILSILPANKKKQIKTVPSDGFLTEYPF